MTENTVAEADNVVDKAPPTATDGAQDDQSLESILAEYDSDVTEAPEPTQAQDKDTTQGLDTETVNLLRQFAENQQHQEFSKTVETAVGTMQEIASEADLDLPDKVWRGVLYETAESDARFKKAFVERGKNPTGWSKALKALAREVSQEMNVSKSDTDQRNQVNAAVKASKKTTPVNAEDAEAEYRRKVQNMSPAEREQEKRKLLRERRFGG